MWGTSQALAPIVQGPGGTVQNASQQLAKIQYRRPDTWRFMFGLVLDNVPNAGGGTVTVTANIDLIVGIGRSVIRIPAERGPNSVAPGFAQFITSYTGTQGNGRTLWTTATRTPILNVDPLDIHRPLIDMFPAEEIQVSARVYAFGGGGNPAIGQPIHVTVHAYLAPISHVRPDWYSDEEGDDDRYKGQEQGGT
jgi:hypothetical protein